MRPAIYCRVSTQEQQERQTILTQREQAEHWLRLQGVEGAVYIEDDGVSGSLPLEKRPGGARLLREVAAGRFDTLIVYKIDRLARSLLELLRFVEVLDRHGVAFRSLSESFDTSTALGRLILQILGAFAELERSMIRERTMSGKQRQARAGRWQGGPPPYGYALVEGRLVIQEPEATLVRELYTLCLDGMGSHSVASLLNARGLPSPIRARETKYHGRGRWGGSTVRAILHNPAYRGAAKWGRAEVACPPLVSRETWEAAEAKLLESRDLARSSAARDYLLRGLVRCGWCGDAACGTTTPNRGRRYVYYRCARQSLNRYGDSICRSPHVPAERLERLVLDYLLRQVQGPEAWLAECEAQLREAEREAAPAERELAALGADETGLQEERGRVIGLVRRGLASEAEVERDLRELQEGLDALAARRELLLARQVPAWEQGPRLTAARAGMEQAARELAAGVLTEAELLRRFVARVIINEGRQPGVVALDCRIGPLVVTERFARLPER